MSNEVFVVGDLLTSYYTNNLGLTNTSNIGGTITTNLPLITTGGLTSGNTNYQTLEYRQPTYNDFWNFDEQFDLLWKSFFDSNSVFKPVKEKVVNHPCDIQETDNGLRIEIAAVGLDKEDIDIIVDSETLRIAHRKTEEDKQKENDEYRYLHRSIKKASFDIAWKISSKYELTKLEAKLDKGLLTLDIPFAKENKPKKISIK